MNGASDEADNSSDKPNGCEGNRYASINLGESAT
jgi:hypothetical protein